MLRREWRPRQHLTNFWTACLSDVVNAHGNGILFMMINRVTLAAVNQSVITVANLLLVLGFDTQQLGIPSK